MYFRKLDISSKIISPHNLKLLKRVEINGIQFACDLGIRLN